MACLFEPLVRGHSERLVPMIEEALDKATITIKEIGLIAVTTGPGGFTGIRLGLATAQGLQIATGIPVAGVTTLSALGTAAAILHNKRHPTLYLAVIDSKRGDVFAQAFVGGDQKKGGASHDLARANLDLELHLTPITEPQGVPRHAVVTRIVQPAVDALTRAGHRPPFDLQVIGNLPMDVLETLLDGHQDLEHQILAYQNLGISEVDVVSAEPDARFVAQYLASATADHGEVNAFGISDSVHVSADLVPPPLYIRPPDVSKPKTRTPTLLEPGERAEGKTPKSVPGFGYDGEGA